MYHESMVYVQAMHVILELMHKSDQQLRGFVMIVLLKSMALLGCLTVVMLELIYVVTSTVLIDCHDYSFFCDVRQSLA